MRLPGLERFPGLRQSDSHPCIHDDATAGPSEDRVQVELQHLWKIFRKLRDTKQEILDGFPVSRSRPRKAGEQFAGFPGVGEFLCVVIGQGRESEASVADQLGERAARSESNERAEHRVLNGADENFNSTSHHRLDEKRRADSLCSFADSVGVSKVNCNASAFGLVHARLRSLDNNGIADFVAVMTASSTVATDHSETSGNP